MAIAVASSAITQAGSGVSSITATEPSGAASGDLLLAWHGVDGGETEANGPPTGWTLELNGTATRVVDLQVSSIVRGASAPSLVFPHTTSEEGQVIIARITGQDASPIGASELNDGNSTAPTCPSITTTKANSLVFFGYVSNGANLTTEDTSYPLGTTGLFNRDSSENAGAMTSGLAYQAFATTGATGTKAWATVGALDWFAFSLEILEADAAVDAIAALLLP